MMDPTYAIDRLVSFAAAHSLIDVEDRAYVFNRLMEHMRLDAPGDAVPASDPLPDTAAPLLRALTDLAVANGLIGSGPSETEHFSAILAGEITPPPAVVRDTFRSLYQSGGPDAATEWFYHMCRACDYIRTEQVARNVKYFSPSPCGELEITINLSKPEKDPRAIAALKNAPQVGYPKCMLCVENPGYAGRVEDPAIRRADYPARHNHRMVPLTLGGERWHLQYSPYLYYNEHCIVLASEHRPMRVDRASLGRLFDFVEQFPHYFIGSNADLPIVGGSILNHDHFQGGRHSFPMDRAGVRFQLAAPVRGVEAHVLDWPMTAIRLTGGDRTALINLAVEMLNAWRAWSDPALDILAETDALHNAITPILRREESAWRLNLVLRNNRTSETHPLGIFHPHAPLHHIKKENIGLIEVMGLFVLPGRLKDELAEAAGYLTGEKPLSVEPDLGASIAKHFSWLKELAQSVGTELSQQDAEAALRQAVANVCAQVLADAGVYKRTSEGDEGLIRFLSAIGYSKVD